MVQIKKPAMFHNFLIWTDPSQLGYAMLGSMINLLWCASAAVSILGGKHEPLDIFSWPLLGLWSVNFAFMPLLALFLALRDGRSAFGYELRKTREQMGLFTSKEEKQAWIEQSELDACVNTAHPHDAPAKKIRRL